MARQGWEAPSVEGEWGTHWRWCYDLVCQVAVVQLKKKKKKKKKQRRWDKDLGSRSRMSGEIPRRVKW